jgi:hypothetical protein
MERFRIRLYFMRKGVYKTFDCKMFKMKLEFESDA